MVTTSLEDRYSELMPTNGMQLLHNEIHDNGMWQMEA